MTRRRFELIERDFGRRRNHTTPWWIWFAGFALIALAMFGRSTQSAAADSNKNLCSNVAAQVHNPDAAFSACLYPE